MVDRDMLAAIRAMMKEELQPILADLAEISERTARMEQIHGQKINGLYESVVGTGEKLSLLNLVEGRINRLEDDVFAIKARIAE